MSQSLHSRKRAGELDAVHDAHHPGPTCPTETETETETETATYPLLTKLVHAGDAVPL